MSASGEKSFVLSTGTADSTRGCFTGGGALHSYFSPVSGQALGVAAVAIAEARLTEFRWDDDRPRETRSKTTDTFPRLRLYR